MKSVRARARVALAALAAAVVVVAAAPVAADAAYVRIQNQELNWCLDSNARGSVYINPCTRGNRYQLWERWDGGWTRNVATGRCLSSWGGRLYGSVFTTDCVNPVRYEQVWRSWQGGWYQRPAIANRSPAGCLTRRPDSFHGVAITACHNPFGAHHPRELWSAR